MRSSRHTLGAIGLAALLLPSDAPGAGKPAPLLPGELIIREPGLYPEDVEWDGQRGRFLVSSAAQGTINFVRDDGALEPFIPVGKLKSSMGMHIDRKRNRLLVAGADFAAVKDPKVQGEARLAIYSLTTGKQERLVELAGLRPAGRHLANDLTIDPLGNAYVTDSLSPLIYRITPQGHAKVFLEDARLAGKGINLNGIAYHPGGYLLVVVGGQKAIYRIPVGAPETFAKVQIPEPVLIDSLTFRPNGNLIAAVPFVPGVIELTSFDGWRSAQIIGRAFTSKKATTTSATLRDGAIYGLNSHFDEMGKARPVQQFEIFRAVLH